MEARRQPGGGSLFVSMKETLFLETLNVWTRRSLEKGTLCIRWMDDVLHVAVRSMGRAAKAALKRMQRKKFYGEGLDLLEEEGETRAFGFEWEANGSVLVCRGVSQSEAEENSRAGDERSVCGARDAALL